MARSQTTAQTRAGKSIASKQVTTKKGILRERKKTEASLDVLSGIGTLGSVVTTATDWALPTYQEWEDYETGKEALGLDTEELTEWQKTV